MEAPDKPPIDLSHDRVMCDRHGQPFRAKWPSSYPGFVLIGLQALMEVPEFQDLCGGKVDQIGALLDLRPICCRLPKDRLFAVYMECQEKFHTWHVGRCRVCRKRDVIGGPYQFSPRPGRIKTLDHMCLRCVVYADAVRT